MLALERSGMDTLCVGGGVAANHVLRARLQAECEQAGVVPHIVCSNFAPTMQ